MIEIKKWIQWVSILKISTKWEIYERRAQHTEIDYSVIKKRAKKHFQLIDARVSVIALAAHWAKEKERKRQKQIQKANRKTAFDKKPRNKISMTKIQYTETKKNDNCSFKRTLHWLGSTFLIISSHLRISIQKNLNTHTLFFLMSTIWIHINYFPLKICQIAYIVIIIVQ